MANIQTAGEMWRTFGEVMIERTFSKRLPLIPRRYGRPFDLGFFVRDQDETTTPKTWKKPVKLTINEALERAGRNDGCVAIARLIQARIVRAILSLRRDAKAMGMTVIYIGLSKFFDNRCIYGEFEPSMEANITAWFWPREKPYAFCA